MIKSLLRYSYLYILLMRLLGGKRSTLNFINDYTNIKPNERVLDLGCGPAQILSLLPKVEYTGIDASSNYISAAKNKFPNQKFICDTFDSNTKLNGKFDIVLAVGLIHHLDNDTSRNLINNASNVLKDGGKLITIDNVFYKGQRWITKSIIKQDRGNYTRYFRDYTSLFPQNLFSEIQFDMREDLIRIPYSHVISVCIK